MLLEIKWIKLGKEIKNIFLFFNGFREMGILRKV